MLRPITTCALSFATHATYPVDDELRAVVYAAFILVSKSGSVKQEVSPAELAMNRIYGTETPPNGADTPSPDCFLRMLCVDDNAPLLQTMALGFAVYGFEVITASHGIDAIMQFQARGGRFDVIVTDNDMPRMNGLEFVRSVRALGFKGRILVMSGRLSAWKVSPVRLE